MFMNCSISNLVPYNTKDKKFDLEQYLFVIYNILEKC
jgi:hypothetical protein